MSDMQLTRELADILRHTLINRRWAGRTGDVTQLEVAGYMQSCGFVSWCPDEYFAVTPAGREALIKSGHGPRGVERMMS